MIRLIKWYFEMWRKPESEWSGLDCIHMAWASMAIIIGIGGLIALSVAIFNTY
jgi:hypothetical protein